MIDPVYADPKDPDFVAILNRRIAEISSALQRPLSDSALAESGRAEILAGTQKQRLSILPGSRSAGTTFWETDTKSLWVIDQTGMGHLWRSVSGGGSALVAHATGTLTLSTASFGDVPGASVTLVSAGSYLVTGVFDFRGDLAGDSGADLRGYLSVAGTRKPEFARFTGAFGAVTLGGTVAQQWIATGAAAGDVLKLQGQKSAGTGGSSIGVQSAISALLLGA